VDSRTKTTASGPKPKKLVHRWSDSLKGQMNDVKEWHNSNLY